MVYTAPGVYVVEDNRTPMPLVGVPTGVPCFFGFTHQGPYLKPTRISSLAEFNAIFGPRVLNKAVFPNAYMADAIYGFFLNGGAVCYVCRVNGGEAVAWPVRKMDHVVDYEDLASEFSAHTPQDPKYMSLTVKAASPGSWANNLIVKIAPEIQSEGLPLIDMAVGIPADSLPDAPTDVDYSRLDSAGSLDLPEKDNLNAQCKLVFGVGDDADEGAWDGTKFAGFKNPLPTKVGPAMLNFSLTKGGETKTIEVPVKYRPDFAFDPALIKKGPKGDGDAITPAEFALWNASTKLVFDGVQLHDEAGKVSKVTLKASWSVEDQKFYFLTSDGRQAVLNKLTVKAAEAPKAGEGDDKDNAPPASAGPLEKGDLTYPLDLNEGDTLTFRVDVIEPVPPKAPGAPVTYRLLESYPHLNTVPGDAKYFMNEGLINGVSNRIAIEQGVGAGKAFIFGESEQDGVTTIVPAAVGARALNKGTDAAPAPTDYLRFFPLLKQVDDVSIVACPDVYSQGVTTPSFAYQPALQAGIEFCENNRCMMVIDAPPQPPVHELGDMNNRVENIERFVGSYRSLYAAVYSPWLVVPNTDPTDTAHKTRVVPPSGHMIGIYNQSDNAEGVWSAPANMSVKGPVALNLPFTEDESAQLNPQGVNLIRAFTGQGVLVWGARTTTLDVMWQYVNVRRLFLYVERTLQQQTQWAVFEPNVRRTWNTLVNAAENFLRQIWLDGGLAGDTPDQAYRVMCGVPETMTQTDVDTGLLKVEVAIAPVKPAEFVVFTVSQLVQTPS